MPKHLLTISFLLITLITGCSMNQSTNQAPTNNFRVITYNVLYGFEDKLDQCPIPGEQRQAEAFKWLSEQQPDIVAFQEMNGWTQERLLQEAPKWGHPYAVLLHKSAFNIAVTSKYPITEIEQHKEGMHHGLIHCKTAGINIFATHYSPHKYKHRQQEVAMTLQRIQPVIEAGGEILLMGDLNSLSATDEQRLLASESLERWRQREKELDFLRNLNNDYFDFSGTDALLDAGLIDIYHADQPDSDFWPRSRIDYIFASPKLAKKCTKTQWVANDTMRQWSDHYPLIADFDWQIPE